MTVYNTTFMNNATNIVDLMVGVGEAMNEPYLLGYLTLLSFFLIFLILSVKYDFNEVLMIDGFLTTLLTILFATAGIAPFFAIIYPAVIFFIALLFRFFIK